MVFTLANIGLPGTNGGPFHVLILRWNGTAWTEDTGGTINRDAEAAATFPGAARSKILSVLAVVYFHTAPECIHCVGKISARR